MKGKGKKSAQIPELVSEETLKKLSERIKQLRVKRDIRAMNISPMITIYQEPSLEDTRKVRI